MMIVQSILLDFLVFRWRLRLRCLEVLLVHGISFDGSLAVAVMTG